MTRFPNNLAESIPNSLLDDAHRWWSTLSDLDRKELAMLCDARREIFLFETFSGEDSPTVTGGKFIPHDNAFGIDEWGEDYFQHLLDHPELIIVYDAELKTFHIGCSRHIEARRCFASGVVDANYSCPFELAECLMHTICAGRDRVGIRPVRKKDA